MPLDPNIILGAQPSQFQSPLDAITKAMTLKHLANSNQIEGQQIADQQALRQAYANNTSVDQSGNTTINRQGVLADLAKTSPSTVPQVQQGFANMDFEVQKQHLATMQNKLQLTGQLLGGVTDQKSYDTAISQIKEMGGNTSQLPPGYDPGAVKNAQMWALSAKDQVEAKAKQQGLDLQSQDLAIKREQFQQGKQQEAFKDLMSHAESSRQLPDVKQAYLDRYNSQKVLDLVGTGDPNKLPPNMVSLLTSEVGKIAQGNAPTEETLKNLSPQDAQMVLSRTKQYLVSHPEAGEQGAFVTVFRDYAKTIQSGANKVIDNNLGKLGSSYQPHVSSGDYQNFVNNYIKGNPSSGDSSAASAPPTGATKEWNGKTYKVVGGNWVAQ